MGDSLDRAERRRAARRAGDRGTKSKRRHPLYQNALEAYKRGDLKPLPRKPTRRDPSVYTQELPEPPDPHVAETIARAKRLREMGFTITDHLLWTPPDR